MSNFKVMFHRFFQSSCKSSQEKMLHKWRAIVKLKGGVWGSNCTRFFNDQLTTLKTFGMQCNVIAAHRARRTVQIMQLYRNLYGKTPVNQVLKKLGELIKDNPKDKMFFLLGAAFFDWSNNKVTDKDLKVVEEDLKPFFDCKASEPTYQDHDGEVWEKLLDKDHFKLWRCPVKGTSLYKYKVFGTYRDIPATAFFNIQLDLEYRKTWDNHVIRLEKVEEDKKSGSEVIYWATYFPLGFLYNRDYIFVRRYKVDEEQKLMMLTNQSVDHPSFPETKEYVRVAEYSSQMLIRPHTTFDNNGFDYVMSYYDNPHLYVPTWAINKMTVQSLPAFLEQLHVATQNLVKSKTVISGYHSRPTSSTSSYLQSEVRNVTHGYDTS